MKRNMGKIDRSIRVIAGLALLIWHFFFGGPIWALFGFIPLSTALMNFCPIYALLGINTDNTQ